MSLIAATEDRFSFPAPEPGDRGQRLAVSYSGSIAINALFLALMMAGIEIYAKPLDLIEMPIEVTIEAPPVQQARPLPLFMPPPAAAFNAQSKYAFDMRKIADEERQRKDSPDGTSVDGDGTAKSWTASPNTRSEKRDSEELKNDPDKEAYRLVPPPDSQSRQKTKIAPPGEDSKAWATDEPKAEAADETTAKREEITCGANEKRLQGPIPPPPWRGEVLYQLTKDQAERVRQASQVRRDRFASPEYLDNIRVQVRVDGWISWTVLVPYGLTVRVGDRVEFTPGHVDPSRPCHYIPNLLSRVL
jgi:hypothetical protein